MKFNGNDDIRFRNEMNRVKDKKVGKTSTNDHNSYNEGSENNNVGQSMKRQVAKHTLRCLIGCNIGDAAGTAIGFIIGLEITQTIIIGIGLAFVFGYVFTILPLLKKMTLIQATRGAIVGDTASISSMEIAEIGVGALIPGFYTAGLTNPIFWTGLIIVLPIGYFAAYPAMYWGMKKEMERQEPESNNHV